MKPYMLHGHYIMTEIMTYFRQACGVMLMGHIIMECLLLGCESLNSQDALLHCNCLGYCKHYFSQLFIGVYSIKRQHVFSCIGFLTKNEAILCVYHRDQRCYHMYAKPYFM